MLTPNIHFFLWFYEAGKIFFGRFPGSYGINGKIDSIVFANVDSQMIVKM